MWLYRMRMHYFYVKFLKSLTICFGILDFCYCQWITYPNIPPKWLNSFQFYTGQLIGVSVAIIEREVVLQPQVHLLNICWELIWSEEDLLPSASHYLVEQGCNWMIFTTFKLFPHLYRTPYSLTELLIPYPHIITSFVSNLSRHGSRGRSGVKPDFSSPGHWAVFWPLMLYWHHTIS